MIDKKILIAVDESENSKMALLYVADFLGGLHGFKAIVLSVLYAPEDGFFESEEEKKKWLESRKESLSRMLERYRQILIQSGFPEKKVKTELVITDNTPVTSVILDKQEEFDACTLVVGRRGVSKPEEFLFGSVSSKVVHMAHRCAVWVIEPVCKASY